MNILVTGATGYIGRHLCKQLLDKGFNVIALAHSRENTSSSTESFKIFTQSMAGLETKLRIINCDIADYSGLLESFEKAGPVDCIFHLAGQVLRKDLADPHIYFRNNFIGTLNVLECSRIFNIKRLIFSSSIAVYGLSPGQYAPKYMPVDELHEVNPYDFYDLSKYQAEQLCKYYHDRFGIKVVILRYSRVYGPDMIRGFIYQSIKKAFAGDTLEIFENIGTDFVFIEDVINANILSFEKAIPKFEIFNIGSGEEITLHDICLKIIKLTNSSSKINIRDKTKSKFSLDISKARRMLSYHPIELEQGLLKCVEKMTLQK